MHINDTNMESRPSISSLESDTMSMEISHKGAKFKRTISIDTHTLATIFSRRDCEYCKKEPMASTVLSLKYENEYKSYNKNVINEIIFNEATHVVSVFKDYLIYDDNNEFLTACYTVKQSYSLLRTIANKNLNTCIMPNMCILSELTYILKNTKLKKKAAEETKKLKFALNRKRKNDKIFDTRFISEIKRCKSCEDIIDDKVDEDSIFDKPTINKCKVFLPFNMNLRQRLKVKALPIQIPISSTRMAKPDIAQQSRYIKSTMNTKKPVVKKPLIKSVVGAMANNSKKSTACTTKQSILGIKSMKSSLKINVDSIMKKVNIIGSMTTANKALTHKVRFKK
jgi:hypothetical protein